MKKNKISSSLVTLMGGTLVAQTLPIVASPILTRIYTPDDYGVLAIYAAILSIISVFSLLRYELAIPQTDKDVDALALVHLSICICLILTFFCFCIIASGGHSFAAFIGLEKDSKILYLLPLGFFINGMIKLARYWFLKKENYKQMSAISITQSFGTSTGQVLLGYSSFFYGLVWGQIFGLILASAYVSKQLLRSFKIFVITAGDLKNIYRMMIKYRKLPIYSSVGALADSFSLHLPMFAINKIFGNSILGSFSFTFKVLNLPLSALSQSLSQIVFQKVCVFANEAPEKISPFLLKTSFWLLCLSTPFTLCFLFFGRPIFSFIFGQDWADAGEMASILVLAVSFRFCVSPLSGVLALEKNVKWGTYWQLTYVITIATTLFVSRHLDFQLFLIVFLMHEIVLYTAYFILILICANKLNEKY